MNALVSLPLTQATASINRAVIPQRIVALLCEREANQKALRAASARFNRRPRGPSGP
jgi:hypothetical protein